MARPWLRGALRPTAAADPAFRGLDIRRNFIALLIDAVGWPLGQSFLSPQTVLPMFIAELTRSNFTIGLVVAIQSIGQLVGQLLSSNRVERMPTKHLYVFVVGVLVERLPYLVLAATVLLFVRTDVVLFVFFICWITANLGVGINLSAYLGLYAKVMPPVFRGRLTGIGTSVGTLLAAGGAYLTGRILEGSDGYRGFGWVFAIGFVILTASVVPFLFIDERRVEPPGQRRKTLAYLSELPQILRSNRPFARFVFMQTILQFVFTSTPFITGYAALTLGVSLESVGVSTAIFMAASTIGSFVFGLIADSSGYRRVLLISAAIGTLTYAVLIFHPVLWVVWICYFLAGLVMSGVSLGNNMAMEYCPSEKAVSYTTILFSAGAPIRAAGPVLLGILADRVGMSLVFVAITFMSFVALIVGFYRVSEPRFAAAPPAADRPPSD